MFIHQIAGITDTECILQLNIKSAAAENLKIIGGDHSVFLKKEADGVYMKVFVEQSIEPKLALNPEAFQNISGYLALTEKFESSVIHEFIKHINSVPTAMMHQPYLSRGKLNIVFSYRHTFSKKISDIMVPVVTTPELVHNISIHPSKGALERILRMNSDRPITVIRYSVHRDAHNDKRMMDLLESSNSIGRMVNDYLETKKFKLAVISEKPMASDENIESVPDMPNSYWITINNPILGKIIEKAASRGIYIDTTYIMPVDKKIVITQFVPRVRALEYIQILFSTSMEEIQRNDVSIEMANDLNEDLIKHI
jgi:hypothetical protein